MLWTAPLHAVWWGRLRGDPQTPSPAPAAPGRTAHGRLVYHDRTDGASGPQCSLENLETVRFHKHGRCMLPWHPLRLSATLCEMLPAPTSQTTLVWPHLLCLNWAQPHCDRAQLPAGGGSWIPEHEVVLVLIGRWRWDSCRTKDTALLNDTRRKVMDIQEADAKPKWNFNFPSILIK